MGLRIFIGEPDGDARGQAVLFCSTSMRALPFIFESGEDADRFLEWVDAYERWPSGARRDFRVLPSGEQSRLFAVWCLVERSLFAAHVAAEEELERGAIDARAADEEAAAAFASAAALASEVET